MHSYLPSIGFSEIKNKAQMDLILKDALDNPTSRTMTTTSSDTSNVQINKEYGSGIGITIIGEYNNKGILNVEHYFPYATARYQTREDEINIEKHSGNESYAGVCDDINIGASLIFYVQNIADYIRGKWLNHYAKVPTIVQLAALASTGTILLDVQESPEEKKRYKNTAITRNQLISAARSGDADALEKLTLEDMDTYVSITKRSKTEDIFTIVKSYFMPYGIETEIYAILGSIVGVREITNTLSKKIVYDLSVECNNLLLNVYISKDDLHGEPQVGRRFKGHIWLQGHIDF